MWSFEMVAAMLAVGAVAGVIAGMFGVGGGTILVPLVLWILQMQGAENFQYAQHIAIGTSFAVMVFTSFASARAQYKRQAVDMDVLRAMVPGVLCGVAAGALVAQYLPNKGLQVFFTLFIAILAVRALLGIKPTPERQLPGLARAVRYGRAVRPVVELDRYRRRFADRALFDFLQRAGSPRRRYFGRFGLADCGGGYAGVCLGGLESGRSA